jgi:hypothetical protein
MIFFLYVKKYYVLDFNLQFKLRIKTVFYSIGSELLIFSVISTNNVNTTWALLQTTGGKGEPNKHK